VHTERFPEIAGIADREIVGDWERLLEVRGIALAALEDKRKSKEIGTSLGARVVVTASGPIAAVLERHRDDLPMLFIVSDVALHVAGTDGADRVEVLVEKAPGVRCERCWRYVPRTHVEPEWAGICDRCVEALGTTSRSFA
jgi:isoleucyl-tRNA synthetase